MKFHFNPKTWMARPNTKQKRLFSQFSLLVFYTLSTTKYNQDSTMSDFSITDEELDRLLGVDPTDLIPCRFDDEGFYFSDNDIQRPFSPLTLPVETATSQVPDSDASSDEEEPGELVTNNRDKLGSGIITAFPPTNHPSWLDPKTYWDDVSHIRNWVGQFEICPSTKALHIHIYVEWVTTKRIRLEGLRTAFTKHEGLIRINFKKQRSTKVSSVQGAVNYCLAPGKRAPETQPFRWSGNKDEWDFDEASYENRPKKKQKATKEENTQELIDYIMSKPATWSWAKILHEDDASRTLLATCSWGPGFHVQRVAGQASRTIDKVIVMYGAGGTGKSTMALKWDQAEGDTDRSATYYRRNNDDGHFWGSKALGYQGQKVIHWEEFCGQETFAKWKEYCDIGNPGPKVNVKNGTSQLNHDTCLFTSNIHPAGWYRGVWSKDPKAFHPFWRRVSQVLFFPSHRPDGTVNRPDEEIPPYYIDQTEEWQALNGDYAGAKDHALEHWPLPDDDYIAHPNGMVSHTHFNT